LHGPATADWLGVVLGEARRCAANEDGPALVAVVADEGAAVAQAGGEWQIGGVHERTGTLARIPRQRTQWRPHSAARIADQRGMRADRGPRKAHGESVDCNCDAGRKKSGRAGYPLSRRSGGRDAVH